jgi:ABC-type dipeptide/oligopeptide/nickel transport system permease subunit
MVIFSLQLGWLPASGMWAPYGGGGARDLLAHLALPAVTLAAASVTIIARLTRSTMLEVLGHDYIRTARAKGLVERRVVTRHGLRNALIPIVTVVGVQAGYLLGGAVLTETVFAWPGVGTLMVQGILARDFPLVQGCVLVIALSFVVINLAVDHPLAVLGALVLVVAALGAVLAPQLPLPDPDTVDTPNRLRPPLTADHPLGTDEFGRDLLARLGGVRASRCWPASARPRSPCWSAWCSACSAAITPAGSRQR